MGLFKFWREKEHVHLHEHSASPVLSISLLGAHNLILIMTAETDATSTRMHASTELCWLRNLERTPDGLGLPNPKDPDDLLGQL